MSAPLLQLLSQAVSLLVSTGAIAAFVKAIVTARDRKRSGIEPSNARRRLDLVAQNAALTAALYEQREFCLDHGTSRALLPPLPAFLKEPLP